MRRRTCCSVEMNLFPIIRYLNQFKPIDHKQPTSYRLSISTDLPISSLAEAS